VGEGLRGWRGWLAAGLAALLVAIDIGIDEITDVVWATELTFWVSRVVPTAIVLAALILLSRGGEGGLGVSWRPRQGWGYWLRLSGIVLGVAAVAYLGFALAHRAGWLYLGEPDTSPPGAWFLLQTGILYPVVEEAIYRVALLTPLAPRLGKVATIAIGAIAFALLHVIRYENPSPPNQLGGLFLCWAYLHSGSVAVPLAWHAVGNVILAYANVAASWLV
jgi:membrane protease YdiL (CAAX protease family)